jgi:hypothetical protein
MTQLTELEKGVAELQELAEQLAAKYLTSEPAVPHLGNREPKLTLIRGGKDA